MKAVNVMDVIREDDVKRLETAIKKDRRGKNIWVNVWHQKTNKVCAKP